MSLTAVLLKRNNKTKTNSDESLLSVLEIDDFITPNLKVSVCYSYFLSGLLLKTITVQDSDNYKQDKSTKQLKESLCCEVTLAKKEWNLHLRLNKIKTDESIICGMFSFECSTFVVLMMDVKNQSKI